MLFPYDTFFPDESKECQYCLTETQAGLIRGLLEPVGWPTRWWSDDTEIDKDKIEAFRDDIIRRLMMACCGGDFEIIFQWTEDGVLQQSDDGGETWQDAPQNDPRNSSTIYPPVPGEPSDDKKCAAAHSVRTLVREQVGDQLTDDMSRYTLEQLISDWVTTIIQTSNPFEALIVIATNQIFALVIATLRPALTTDVYDKFQCCVLDNMQDDISFTQEDWEAVRDCILSDISGVAGIFLEHLVFLLGKVGLTNLARSQAESEGDCACSECDGCDTSTWVIQESGGYIFGVKNGDSTCNALIIDQSVVAGDGNYYIKVFAPDNMVCCTPVSLTTSGSPSGLLIAWDEVGETQGTFAHSGSVTDITGHCITSLLVRTSSPQTATLTT
jgi:hypothetical protein